MDLGLEGKKAIVCASSRGLGKACAISLAREGVHVVINGRNEETLTAAEAEIAAIGRPLRRAAFPGTRTILVFQCVPKVKMA